MTKLQIINACLEATGERQISVYDNTKPEQLLANNILSNVTYEVSSILNSLNTLILNIATTSNYDTISTLQNIESVFNYIKSKTVRNYISVKIGTQELNVYGDTQLLEATMALIQFIINKGIPTSYINDIISQLNSLFFVGIFTSADSYVQRKAEVNYRIDLHMIFNIKNEVLQSQLAIKVKETDNLFNGVLSKVIDNGPTTEMIEQAVRELCATAWYFNSINNWYLTPDSLGFIALSNNVLKIESNNGYIKKSGKLYDNVKGVFIFENQVKLEKIVTYVDYQDLPEIAKNYINIKTNRRFINLLSSKLGKTRYTELSQRYTEEEEKRAFVEVQRENNKTLKLNIFNDYYTSRILHKYVIPQPIVYSQPN